MSRAQCSRAGHRESSSATCLRIRGAAGTELASQQTFTFLILGPHEDPASAQRFLSERAAWLDEAQEVWSGILEPLRHHGAANYLDRVSIRAFAYGQGSHRRQLDRHRAERFGDRTSFTRFHVRSSAGTWYGVDPAPRTVDTQD